MAEEEREPRQWNPEEVRAQVELELRTMYADATPEQMMKDQMRAAGPLAVRVLVDLAMESTNETLRARCAQYVVDRLLGRVPDMPLFAGAATDDPLLAMLDGTVTVEDFVNAEVAAGSGDGDYSDGDDDDPIYRGPGED